MCVIPTLPCLLEPFVVYLPNTTLDLVCRRSSRPFLHPHLLKSLDMCCTVSQVKKKDKEKKVAKKAKVSESVPSTCSATGVSVEGMSVTPLEDFASAKMSTVVMTYIRKQNWQRPTPIQSHCWPVLNAGRDVVGIAETGSGKTLAFSLPALSRIFEDRKAKVRFSSDGEDHALCTS